ncbi:MAG: NAD(P)-dependent oxidoreductase [Erysipelotrichia bacterium]|nr:NAD(P)-dependent oxidoreductase [Erysipelotrichia bacterium]
MRIFLTGATGFLGYHVAKKLIDKGHSLLCLKRSTSKNPFNERYNAKIQWVENNDSFHKNISDFAPDILIHGAWAGVTVLDRQDVNIQSYNYEFSKQLIEIYPYKQIIGMGSQDEYGNINSKVTEEHPLHPITQYGIYKIKTCNFLIDYCTNKGIEWQWIRIFNMYGEKQSPSWLIPAIVEKCREGISFMDTTYGEQQYAYLYAEDFGNGFASMIGSCGKSGIYNISASTPVPLKKIFEIIKNITGSNIIFNYGAIPYREGQSMMICGDATKFKKEFGNYEKNSLVEGLKKLIK